MRFNNYLILFFVLFFVSCKGEGVNTENEDWLTVDRDSYSLSYPHNWELRRGESEDSHFKIISQSASMADPFLENVNLLVQDLAGMNLDLDKFIDLSLDQIAVMFPESDIRSNERRRSNGEEFQRLVYSVKYGNLDLVFIQYCWVREEQAYVLTFSSEADCFDRYLNTAERIMRSFKFKN